MIPEFHVSLLTDRKKPMCNSNTDVLLKLYGALNQEQALHIADSNEDHGH